MIAFEEKHPPAKNALNRWSELAGDAMWKDPVEMKRTFPSADIVGAQTVFNIGANKYRLIAMVNYKLQRAVVQYVLTHSEYDRGDWKR